MVAVAAAPVGLGGSGAAEGQADGQAEGGGLFHGRSPYLDEPNNAGQHLAMTGAVYANVINCYKEEGGCNGRPEMKKGLV